MKMNNVVNTCLYQVELFKIQFCVDKFKLVSKQCMILIHPKIANFAMEYSIDKSPNYHTACLGASKVFDRHCHPDQLPTLICKYALLKPQLLQDAASCLLCKLSPVQGMETLTNYRQKLWRKAHHRQRVCSQLGTLFHVQYVLYVIVYKWL